LEEAEHLIRLYQRIPIQFVEVSLPSALEISNARGIHAYDAYMIACAEKYRSPLLTLDQGLVRAALDAGVEVLEVN
jgi:predicted nucleic acid-binding protein